MAKVGRGDRIGHPQEVCGTDGSHPNWMVNTVYDAIQSSIVTATTDYDVKTNDGGWSNIGATARYLIIQFDQDITIKFNASTNDGLAVASTSSPMTINTLEVTNLFITNTSGSTVTVDVFMT